MIPKDKHDIAAVENLKSTDAEAVVPLLPKLLFYSKLVLADAIEQIAILEKTPFNEDNIEAAQETLISFQP